MISFGGPLFEAGDPQAAREWFEQGAALGEPHAMLTLGRLLEDSDPQASREWYEQAAAFGDPNSMLTLGRLLRDSDPQVAREWSQAAREWHEQVTAGQAATFNYQIMRFEASDPEAAREWYEQGAAAGNPNAMLSLGR